MNNADYLERQSKFESNARSYPRRLPLAIAKAEGLYVTDVDGRVYMDCLCGAGALPLGHNHPLGLEAIRRHLDLQRPLQTLDLTTPVKDEFVTDLLATLPSSFTSKARVQFCSPCGTDAVEAALKMVKTATGRSPIWAASGGFHGQTHGSLALMGNHGPKQAIGGLMPGVHFFPFPYRFRCPMGQRRCEGCSCGEYLGTMLSDPESGMPRPAGLITEAVQGEGGVIPANTDWLQAVRRHTSEAGIPLILDEVQTGWCRTGKMYAFEHFGVVPDVLVLSKAIGGGLPLAIVVYNEQLDVWKPGAHSGTFRGNQLAMATGIATLQVLLKDQIAAHATAMGERFLQRLLPLRDEYAFIGDIRGKGLMLGIEIVDPQHCDRANRAAANPTLAAKIQGECFQRGLIVELGGRQGAVVRLLPPLIVDDRQVDAICDVLVRACAAAARDNGPAHV
jgi:diaminobutyrate-2-oxoglutarate transaminase